MDLNALQSTLAITEYGGIAEANRATGIPRSTLSRHLADIERELGMRLIERSSRRFRLTVEGEALVALAAEPLGKLAEIGERLRPAEGNLTGRLRVSVPVMFGQTLLGQLAVALADAHPDLFLDVVVDDRHVDILREGFDAALRVNPPSDSPLFGRLLGRSRLVLVATPELAAAVGYEHGYAERTTWPALVRPGWGDDGTWDVEIDGKRVQVAARPRMALSSPTALLQAVLAHLGAALLPQTLVGEHVASGRLIELGTRFGVVEEIWILHAAGRLPNRRVVALMDALTAVFSRHLPSIEPERK